MALVDPEFKFIFIHIFKTAGNSVRDVITKPGSYELHGVHVDIADVKKHFIGKNQLNFFNECYKFTFVRNPYDWMVSLYSYIKGAKLHEYHAKANAMPFGEFVKWYTTVPMQIPRTARRMSYGTNKFLRQHEFIIDENGDDVIDYVGKIETLDADMHKIHKRIFGVAPVKLKHKNKSKRTPDYRKYYDDTSKAIMEDVFAKDLERFKYAF